MGNVNKYIKEEFFDILSSIEHEVYDVYYRVRLMKEHIEKDAPYTTYKRYIRRVRRARNKFFNCYYRFAKIEEHLEDRI